MTTTIQVSVSGDKRVEVKIDGQDTAHIASGETASFTLPENGKARIEEKTQES